MSIPALVVYGDEDVSPHLIVCGAAWNAEPYTLAPGPKDLLTLKGANHGLGGISEWMMTKNRFSFGSFQKFGFGFKLDGCTPRVKFSFMSTSSG